MSFKKICKKWGHLTWKKISTIKKRWQLVPCLKARALASPGVKQRALESWTQCMDCSLTLRSDFQTVHRGLRTTGHTRLAPWGCVDASFEFWPHHRPSHSSWVSDFLSRISLSPLVGERIVIPV